MCGICGITDFGRPPEHGTVERMTEVLEHRGPDDSGLDTLGATVLGFRRLSIIDLEASHQPLSNEDDSIWLVFNGEIYNFRELRRTLEARGHRFKTGGDGEAIVHAYEEYGLEFVEHLNGMFAVGIWDQREQRLVLARDRLGIKPLYYAMRRDSLAFASETKALLEWEGTDRELDLLAVAGYMNYSSVPGELTCFRGVRRLLPGHLATFGEGGFSIRRYWDIDPTAGVEAAPDELLDRIEETLRDSVRLRMISDVPFGVFLSGGVDSSLVAALMAGLSEQPVESFSIGYDREGGFLNELEFSRRVAERHSMSRHELILRGDDLLRDLDRVIWHLDEPCGDPAAFLTLALSRFSREHVTVVLSGLGGDELFAGYRRYLGIQWQDRYQKIPRVLRERVIRPTLSRLPVSRTNRWLNYVRVAQKFVDNAAPDPKSHWGNIVSYLPHRSAPIFAGDLTQVMRENYTSQAFEEYWKRASLLPTPIDRVMYMDLKMYMVDQLLALQDKMSMAVSQEARVPLLDHRLVELAFSIPIAAKLSGGLKGLLKKLAERHVPRDCIYREKKGFVAPVGSWLKGPLREQVHDLLDPRRVRNRGIFAPEFVDWLLREFYGGSKDLTIQLYQVFLLERWMELFVDRTREVPA